MEQNGKASCGQRSRHIDIRYFFITDHSKRHSIDIIHCPTADMLADFFTKPLQGSLFRKFRSVLLGEAHIDTLHHVPHLDPSEERVGIKIPSSSRIPRNPGSSDSRYPVTILQSSIADAVSVNVNTSHSIETYPEDNKI